MEKVQLNLINKKQKDLNNRKMTIIHSPLIQYLLPIKTCPLWNNKQEEKKPCIYCKSNRNVKYHKIDFHAILIL